MIIICYFLCNSAYTHTGGDNRGTFGGKVILAKWGDYTKRIGIDGTAEAIKEAIKSAFGLRTRRDFWLEDEDEVVRTLDRDMPIGTYTLHLDDGNCKSSSVYGCSDVLMPCQGKLANLKKAKQSVKVQIVYHYI
jgi:hypothetical protein